MERYSIPISDAGQKGGIAGGTVGAVLLVAVLTVFCYRRGRRRTSNNIKELMSSLSDPGSTTDDDAERGMVAHGGLFGSDGGKTASAAESFATARVEPQVSDPSVVTTTSQQVPIMFRPSHHRLISRYPSLPVTPRASTRRQSDLVNPVILLPRPLRLASRAALGRSQSWQAVPRKQPEPAGQGEDGRTRAGRKSGSGSGTDTGSRSRSRSMTAATNNNSSSSMYSTDGATFTQRASGTTDASGLRSTLAHFPRPPPYTFSRGDGRGLGTSWRESFVFSTPDDDEVLLAFPGLARQFEEDPPEVRRK